MELIYTVKSGISLGNDRGKNIFTLSIKKSLSFDIWQFRNGLPNYDDDRKICSDDYNPCLGSVCVSSVLKITAPGTMSMITHEL